MRRALSTALLALAATAPSACDRSPTPLLPEPGPEILDSLPPGGRNPPQTTPAPDISTGPIATWTVPRPDGSSSTGADTGAAQPGGASMPRPTEPPPAPPAIQPPGPDPEILALMGTVRPDRLTRDVARLVAFGTRHPLSPDGDVTRGTAGARTWLAEQLQAAARGAAAQITVEDEAFPLTLGGTSTMQQNVMATLTGIGESKRLVYITAHYDSRTDDPLDALSDAPGADDNASGAVALLELARVLGLRQWDGSIRLMALAAGEHDQAGSRFHAPLAERVGLPIEGVINLDVIGGGPAGDGAPVTDRVRALSDDPDHSVSGALARWARFVAERYGALAVDVAQESDGDGEASDHQPFADAGFPALRLMSAVHDASRQHTARDTAERLDAAYHADVVRLVVALAGNLALAPSGVPGRPAVDLQGAGALATWPALDDPDVAGYWVAMRRANSPAYEDVKWVPASDAPGHTFEELMTPTGSWLFAVAAGDARGHVGRFGTETGLSTMTAGR